MYYSKRDVYFHKKSVFCKVLFAHMVEPNRYVNLWYCTDCTAVYDRAKQYQVESPLQCIPWQTMFQCLGSYLVQQMLISNSHKYLYWVPRHFWWTLFLHLTTPCYCHDITSQYYDMTCLESIVFYKYCLYFYVKYIFILLFYYAIQWHDLHVCYCILIYHVVTPETEHWIIALNCLYIKYLQHMGQLQPNYSLISLCEYILAEDNYELLLCITEAYNRMTYTGRHTSVSGGITVEKLLATSGMSIQPLVHGCRVNKWNEYDGMAHEPPLWYARQSSSYRNNISHGKLQSTSQRCVHLVLLDRL